METPGSPFTGRRVGDFVLGNKLGQGAFGAVYAAEQAGLGREAAVKLLRPSVAVVADGAARFLREAKLAARLDHPYAAHVYAFGAEPDGLLWIAMERVRGTTLSDLIKTSGPLSLDQFVPLFERICEVVQSAHDQGIVHRDLKPANVMVVSRAGRLLPKLLDFGIARSVELGLSIDEATLGSSSLGFDRTHDVALTGQGHVLGSPAYMAPEQWRDVERVGPWTDQYALAVLAYEVLVGTVPFRSLSIEELAHLHVTRKWPALPPPLPAAMSEVLARAAAKKPEDRFAQLGELAVALRESAGFSLDALDDLPTVSDALRDTWTNDGPPPIAEAVALLARARSAAQVEDAVATAASMTVRWLGLVSLAAHSKRGRGVDDDDDDRLALVRELRRRALRDDEWLALARALADRHPIGELTTFLASPVAETLDELVLTSRRRAVARESDARRELTKPVAQLATVLEALGWLCDFPLARHVDGKLELWMGCTHDDRVHVPLGDASPLSDGAMVLLDRDGAQTLLVTPLVRVAVTPGSDRRELFVLVGPSKTGSALTVAMPHGTERDDDAIWPWLRTSVLDDDGLDDDRSPWRGLAPLRTEDGAYYVGRERQVAELVDAIAVQPLVVIVGPSGVGKTSFVQAGVLPALPAGTRWFVMRPGPAPLQALSSALGGAARSAYRDAREIDLGDLATRPELLGERLRNEAIRGQAPCILVVDAFEELFTLAGDPAERDAFVAALGAAASTDEPSVRIVLAMRDDFLCRAEALEPLRGRLGRCIHLLSTPTAADLERIVTVPAARAGYTYDDPALPREMVAAVRDRVGALPLLSFTASRLFELRDRHFKRLLRASYDELGGVTGALVRHADGALDRMPAGDRVIVRRAFSRLVTPEGTRASLGRAELCAALGERGDEIIDRLLAARLLVSWDHDDGERVEVIHETLLTAWPRLVAWLREDSDAARFRAQLATATRQWEERSRPSGLLWRGETAVELRRRSNPDEPLTPSERAFVAASLAADQRGRRRAIGGLAMLSIVLASGSGLLWRANRHISSERERAVEQLALNLEDHARHATLDNDPPLALLYLAEAAKLGAGGSGHDVLVARALRSVVSDAGGATALGLSHAVAQSHDGRLTVVTSEDHAARVFDTATGAIVATVTGHSPIMSVAMSPDGRSIVTGSAAGEVAVWTGGRQAWSHVVTGAPRISAVDVDETSGLVVAGSWDGMARQFSLATGEPRGEVKLDGEATGVRFDPRGHRFAAITRSGELSIYNNDDLARLGTAKVGEGFVLALAFSPDGTTIATGSQDHLVRLWDAATARPGRILVGHSHAVEALEFSRDGRRLASASRDGTARVWNVETGESVVTSRASGGALVSVHFSLDGSQVVTAGADHAARVWDSSTGMPIASMAGHAGPLVDAVFDAAGTDVLTAGTDGAVRRWNVEHALTARRLVPGGGAVDYAPDGTRIATAGADGTVVVWGRDGRRIASIAGHQAAITMVGFDRTSTRLAIADETGNLTICDAATGRCAIGVHQTKGINAARFTPDGTEVVTAGADGYVRAWNARTGSLDAEVKVDEVAYDAAISERGDRVVAVGTDATILALPALSTIAVISKPTALISDVAISADGSTIAIAGRDHVVNLYEHDGTPRAVLDTRGGIVNTIRFRPDGARIVIATEDATAQIWDVAAGRLVNTLAGHGGPVFGVNWSTDGQLVVTASADATARVWDATTAQVLVVLAGHTNMVKQCVFSRDGIVTTSDDGSAILWDVPRNHRDSDELGRLVRCHVPYQLVDGVVMPAEPDPAACPH